MNQLIKFQYPSVDIDSQQVTVELIHGDETMLTVIIDLLSGDMQKTGSLERLKLTANELDGLFDGLLANARYMLQKEV